MSEDGENVGAPTNRQGLDIGIQVQVGIGGSENETSSGELTPELIEKSIDDYLSLRRKSVEVGLLEPQRVRIFVHATSVEAVALSVADGNLRSVYNLICTPGSRVDLMQGGKAKYIAGEVREAVLLNPESQKTLLEHRKELLKFLPWLKEEEGWLEEIGESLDACENVEEIMEQIRQCLNTGVNEGILPNQVRNYDHQWLYALNVIPVEVMSVEERRRIAEKSDAEKFVATTLGHGLEKYTPDRSNPSKQAAICIDVDTYLDSSGFPSNSLYHSGGTTDFGPLTEKLGWWTEAVENIENQPSQIGLNEYADGGALEVDILHSGDTGTTIAMNKKAIALIPLSRKEDLADICGKKLNTIFWFDDTKFNSVDEAIGWLVSTKEGQKLHAQLSDTKVSAILNEFEE